MPSQNEMSPRAAWRPVPAAAASFMIAPAAPAA